MELPKSFLHVCVMLCIRRLKKPTLVAEGSGSTTVSEARPYVRSSTYFTFPEDHSNYILYSVYIMCERIDDTGPQTMFQRNTTYIRLISCTINLGNCASCTCVGSDESQSKPEPELVGNSIIVYILIYLLVL